MPKTAHRCRIASAGDGAWMQFAPIHSLRSGLLLVAVAAVCPLVGIASGMALLHAWQAQRLQSAAGWATMAVAPILIGLAAVVVIAAAAEAWVLRWLSYLERLARAYARGRYSSRPKHLQSAPLEFRALGQAVEAMAAAVETRDQALRDSLLEQTVLLREVHHRVKNNLQIVASLLSLQASRSRDANVRETLRDALLRIDAMSLCQRFMQQSEEPEPTSATELFEAFLGQVRARLGPDSRVLGLSCEVESFSLPHQTASRLVLVTAEALIWAFRASRGQPLHGRLRIGRRDGGVELCLTLQDRPLAVADGGDAVSRDLIAGYARHLRAQLHADCEAGRLSLWVPPERADEAPEPRQTMDANVA